VITGIGIVAGPVDDIDEALRFYCDLLGTGCRAQARWHGTAPVMWQWFGRRSSGESQLPAAARWTPRR
jgi:catechol 2,3-dioxygenase-like lactoylglutathione lyase family enzyme